MDPDHLSGYPDKAAGTIPYARGLWYDAICGRAVIWMRQKIDALLDKITSEDVLKRIYEFIKYIYIYAQQ